MIHACFMLIGSWKVRIFGVKNLLGLSYSNQTTFLCLSIDINLQSYTSDPIFFVEVT